MGAIYRRYHEKHKKHRADRAAERAAADLKWEEAARREREARHERARTPAPAPTPTAQAEAQPTLRERLETEAAKPEHGNPALSMNQPKPERAARTSTPPKKR